MSHDPETAPVADSSLGQKVPLIDLKTRSEDLTRRIHDACREWGFFQIVGHDVEPALLRSVRQETAAFFAASKAQKRTLLRSRDNPWGYFDRELTKTERDKKEIFDIGPDVATGPFAGATPWPAWRASFKPVMLRYSSCCRNLSCWLMSKLAEALTGDGSALDHAFEPADTSFLRLNFYPVADPLAGEAQDAAGLGVHHHTDAGALTVLLQDEVGGLQVYREGVWHNIEPRPDAFVVNIGDMAQIWSNGIYAAPVHRVLAMDRRERMSAPFFYNPSYDTVVAPLPETVSASRPAAYSGVNWGEFRRRRADGDFANYGAEVQISDFAAAPAVLPSGVKA
jgi:isopenicillin N synthase-like dioxygenase